MIDTTLIAATTRKSGIARAVNPVRRIILVVVLIALAWPLGGGTSVADTPAPLPAPPAAAAPLQQSSDYSASLNTQIATVDQNLTSLVQRAQSLAAQAQSYSQQVAANNQAAAAHDQRVQELQSQIQAHNDKVNAYPNGAPPAIAAQLNAEAAQENAEAAQLNAEQAQGQATTDRLNAWQQQLSSQLDQLTSDEESLVSQRQQMLVQMAAAEQGLLQAFIQALAQPAAGGDSASPPDRSYQQTRVPDSGGDAASTQTQDNSLDLYATQNGVPVDDRPVVASPTPATVSELNGDGAADVDPFRTYDGLVPEPNGDFKALIVDPSASSGAQPKSNPLDNAINKGGKATAVVDGKQITIDRVQHVPNKPVTSPADPCATPNSFTPQTQVLMADGSHKPIEDIRLGDPVLATDPVTGRTSPEPVLAQIIGTGEKQLDKVTITDGRQTASVTATTNHPFWDPASRAWVDAGDLHLGEALAGRSGTRPVHVSGTNAYQRMLTVYNLTVANLHTYYVDAGGLDVLVHNANCQSQEQIDKLIDEAANSEDPDKEAEADAAKALRKCVTQFNQKLPPTAPGVRPGEIDVGTAKSIVEVYNGTKNLFDAKGDQVNKYLTDIAVNPEGRRVLLYVPNLGDPANIGVLKNFERTYGVQVFSSTDKLRNYMRRTGENC